MIKYYALLMSIAFRPYHIIRCSELGISKPLSQKSISFYSEQLTKQEDELEILYDKELFLVRHLQDLGLSYDNLFKLNMQTFQKLFQKNLRIWAAFSDIKKIEQLISAQEEAISRTQFSIEKIKFDGAFIKYLQDIQNNP